MALETLQCPHCGEMFQEAFDGEIIDIGVSSAMDIAGGLFGRGKKFEHVECPECEREFTLKLKK